MEILLTVLITLMVVALTVAVINLVRLNKKADELDSLKLDMIDINDSINRMIEDLEKDCNQNMDELRKDYCNRIEGWVRSTDRRFDKTYNDIRLNNLKFRKLDTTINPNADLLKNK